MSPSDIVLDSGSSPPADFLKKNPTVLGTTEKIGLSVDAVVFAQCTFPLSWGREEFWQGGAP